MTTLRLPALRRRRSVVVELGAAHVAAGVFEPLAGGRIRLSKLAFEPIETGAAAEKGWLSRAQAALARIAEDEAFRGAAVIGLPGHLALTKTVSTPAVARGKRPRVFRYEASQCIPYPLEDVVWDYAVLGDDERGLNVAIAAARTETIEELCVMVEAAGFVVERLVPPWAALRRGFLRRERDRAETVLLVSIGARATQLVVVAPNGGAVRSLTLAGNGMTHALGEALKCDFATAEAVKLAGERTSEQQHAVDETTREFARRLQGEVARTFAGWERQRIHLQPTKVYLAGGGSQLPNLADHLSHALKLPVALDDVLSPVEFAVGEDAGRALELGSRLAELVGLAAAEREPEDGAANLLPRARVRKRTTQRVQPVLLTAAGFALLAALPVAVHLHRESERAEARSLALAEAVRSKRARADRVAAALADVAQLRAKREQLSRAVQAKTSWIRFLADLQERLTSVEDVWLDEFRLAEAPRTDSLPAGEAPAAATELRLVVSGRMLDTPERDAAARMRRLRATLTESPFVVAVGEERFDTPQPGLLQFGLTMRLKPAQAL